MKKLVFLGIALISFISCGRSEQASKVQVVNGVYTEKYPAVVKIAMTYPGGYYGSCTGTFIKDDLLLTAAHCVHGATKVSTAKANSIRIYKNSKYIEDNYNWISHDLALVQFPKGTSKYTMDISKKSISDKDEVKLVGFGLNDYQYIGGSGVESPYSRSGIKREASNSYRKNSYFDEGVIAFKGLGNNVNGFSGDGRLGSLGQGDSGGPLIVEGKGIVGIASAQGLEKPADTLLNNSYYCYVLSSSANDFFNRAKSAGIYDGSTTTIPNVPTPDEPKPEGPIVIPGSFDFFGVGGNGIYSLKFVNLPKASAKIDFFWGYSSSYAIKTLTINNVSQYETESAWGFGEKTQIKVIVYDKNNKVLISSKKDIAK